MTSAACGGNESRNVTGSVTMPTLEEECEGLEAEAMRVGVPIMGMVGEGPTTPGPLAWRQTTGSFEQEWGGGAKELIQAAVTAFGAKACPGSDTTFSKTSGSFNPTHAAGAKNEGGARPLWELRATLHCGQPRWATPPPGPLWEGGGGGGGAEHHTTKLIPVARRPGP